MKEWHKMRAAILAKRRGLYVGAALVIGLVIAFVPVSTTIMVPALIEDRDLAQVFPPRGARVVEISARPGDRVEAGAPIAALVSHEVEHEIRRTELKIASTRWRIARSAGDRVDRGVLIVLEQSLDSHLSKLAGLQNELAELRLTAPVAGNVVELAPSLYVDRWVQRSDLIALVAPGLACSARGYISEDDLARINQSVPGRFVPESLFTPSSQVQLKRVSAVGTAAMDLPELASQYGGGVAARPVSRTGEARQLVPVTGQFLVAGDVLGDANRCTSVRSERGTLHLTGRAESLAARTWRRFLKVVIRESGL